MIYLLFQDSFEVDLFEYVCDWISLKIYILFWYSFELDLFHLWLGD